MMRNAAESRPAGTHDAPTPAPSETQTKWKFSDIIAIPEIRERWDKVRKYFYVRESTYDMTNRCNIRCEGCYYYQGEKQSVEANRDPEHWRALIQAERKRGITYVVLAGAEPALEPDLLKICFDEIPLGAIATNGITPIPQSIGYKVHISAWGNDETSHRVRGATRLLKRQVDNYIGDPRAVFVYTFTRHNIDEAHEVFDYLVERDCKATFNMFSAPVGYDGSLRHTTSSLGRTRSVMLALMERHPKHVLFSTYGAIVHTHSRGLHDLFKCPYPRMNPSNGVGLGRSFRQYRTDLTWDRDAACCVPDTDCADCRHYAPGSAVVTAKLHRHASHPALFRAWLDYADTYLSIWVTGYERGAPLSPGLVPPPGFELDPDVL